MADPRPRTLARWLGSTSNRTFILYPLCVIAFELALNHGVVAFVPWGLPLLLAGYLQYRWVGRYRSHLGGGGPGIEAPPDRLVTDGPYRWVRNPMYLGHLVFMLGLAVTFWSWAALLLLAFHIGWFHHRVLGDEARLAARFGPAYAGYTARVKRWIPGVL